MNKIIVSLLLLPLSATAQIGQPFIHDPSTIAECGGRYYTFGTGQGGLVSDDGWSWRLGGERPGGGAAPDVIKLGGRYLVVYGATGGGLGGGHNGRILTMWNNTLDPQSPDFKFSEPVEVASSDGIEDNDAIDPGIMLDPKDGRLWLSYGTYFGNIRLIELDPKTGRRIAAGRAKDIAIDCEATDLICRDGWYYLLGTHGTCCDGANSTYNIVVGRSRSVQGPYLDNIGRDMLHGGGRIILAANGRSTGAGHFGRTIIDRGVEAMSCHYEADMDRGGQSVLHIRPLLWRDGWPVAGERLGEGEYEIVSERHGYALELATDFVRIDHPRRLHFGAAPTEDEPAPVPSQTLADVESHWPAGRVAVRMGDYMFRPNQRWQITPAPEAGGYLTAPYYRIAIAGTNRALTATAALGVEAAPADGSDAQLWRVEQTTDGRYRIMPKAIPGREGTNKDYVLYAIADSTPTLALWDADSDCAKWSFAEKLSK